MAERGFVVVVCGIFTMSSRCSDGDKNTLAWGLTMRFAHEWKGG
jgi:hypothetical protein